MTAPDGHVWTVGRQWFGERPRLRRELERERDLGGGGDGGDHESWWSDLGGFDDLGAGAILAALGVVVALIVLFTAVWPIVVIAVELVILVLVAAVGLIGRLLFRRPWTVQARARHRRLEWQVRGWRASGELIDEVAERLAAGEDPKQIES